MSEIVFILGAGASKHTGAPLMVDFLGKADELRKAEKVGEFKPDFDLVFDAISKLQIVHSKSELDLDNIESVFAAFEMGRLINRLPQISTDRIKTLIVSIKRLILKTLEQTITYPVRDKKILPTSYYNAFAELINDLNQEGIQNRCSIITFNYDLALDHALNFNGHPPDYCLLESQEKKGHIPILKLHGSLNWTRCSKCGEIIPLDLNDFFQKHGSRLFSEKKSVILPMGSLLSSSDIKHCNQEVEPEPIIIPPTWNKTEHHQHLSKVWSRAASELSEAEKIFVSGYSLPESDYFFRFLFALGSAGQTRIKSFYVFDPDEAVADRFKTLISQDTKKKFRHPKIRFEDAIEAIRQELKN
jgi:NAD-dependent SIR2 family protein deacetylase